MSDGVARLQLARRSQQGCRRLRGGGAVHGRFTTQRRRRWGGPLLPGVPLLAAQQERLADNLTLLLGVNFLLNVDRVGVQVDQVLGNRFAFAAVLTFSGRYLNNS